MRTYALLPLSAAALVSQRARLPGGVRREAACAAVEMKYRVAVIGGGPSGACAAEILAQDPNIETYIIERKMNNAKPCHSGVAQGLSLCVS